MKRISTLILLLCAFCAWAVEVTSSWQIVLCSNADASIQYAGKVLSEQLGKSQGKVFNVIGEKDYDGHSPAIFLGWSESITPLQADRSRQWQDEEWLIRKTGAQLIQISGSTVRGTLYGSLEFLERFAGYRAYAVDMEYVDKKETLVLPDDLHLTGKPAFPFRNSSFGVYSDNPFWVHNRSFVTPKAEYGWYELTGSPAGVHTFYYYSQGFKSDDCYSLSETGVRQKAVGKYGPGQICMSNPGARQAVLEKLLAEIRKEREQIDRTRPGSGYPKIYALSVNDTPAYCHCQGCQELYQKYGARSGAQLEFLNAIAAEVAKVYPDVYIMGEAYEFLADPPQNITADPHVLIRIAQLGNEFAKVGVRESMLPLNHPSNQVPLQQLQGWAQVAPHLAIWDYGRLYIEPVSLPYTTVRAHASDIQRYAASGVLYAYLEGEFYEGERVALQSFLDLEHYTHMRMLIAPKQNVETLIADFMQKYYGAAAPYMQQLLALLEKRMAEDPEGFSGKTFQKRNYLDKDLVLQADQLLTAAEKAVENDSERLAHVRQERLPFDSLVLNKSDLRLLSDQGGPWDRAMVAKRWKEVADAVVMKYCFDTYYKTHLTRAALLANNLTYFKEYSNPVELPEFLKNASIVADCTAGSFVAQDNRFKIVPDPDAASGNAAALQAPDHDQPFEIGLYESKMKKVVDRKMIFLPAQDEQYHWCKFSNILFTPDIRMWAHASWGMTTVLLNRFYDPRNPQQLYDVYFSFKLEGPSYVKGSAKRDGCFIDRVIVTQADDRIQPPPTSTAATVEPPAFLRNSLQVADFTAANFEPQGANCKMVADADAVLGMAISYTGNKHDQAYELGVYDNKQHKTVRRLTIADPPQDEQYHWYKLENIPLTPNTRMWGHYTWGHTPIKLEKVYNPSEPNRVCDIFVSCKLQGPAYVKNSQKPNGCFIDRIIITAADSAIVPAEDVKKK